MKNPKDIQTSELAQFVADMVTQRLVVSDEEIRNNAICHLIDSGSYNKDNLGELVRLVFSRLGEHDLIPGGLWHRRVVDELTFKEVVAPFRGTNSITAKRLGLTDEVLTKILTKQGKAGREKTWRRL